MNSPWLSVVIPVFRAEEVVEEALQSITSQGLSDVEIICVDDCSPDGSVDLIKKLQEDHPEIVLLHNEKNRGPGGSTNHGIEVARGEYVVIVHADDILLPGALDAIVLHTRQYLPDLVLLDCEEIRRGRSRPLPDEDFVRKLLDRPAPLVASTSPDVLFWPPGPWSKIYRRDFLNRENLRFPDGVFEDIPWSARTTVLAKSITVLPGPHYRYITSEKESSITTSLNHRNLDRLNQIRLIRELLDLSGLTHRVIVALAALAAIHLIWANRGAYKTIPPETHRRFFNESSLELRAWDQIVSVPAGLDSRPLMSAHDRRTFSSALRRGDWNHWQKTLQRQKTLSRLRRMLRPGRVFGSR